MRPVESRPSGRHARHVAFDYVEKAQEPEALFRRIDAALREQAARRATGPAASLFTTRPGPEGERCVLTVLFADLQRSTELLLSRDLDEGRRILDAVLALMIEAAHEAGGTVNQVVDGRLPLRPVGRLALKGIPAGVEAYELRGEPGPTSAE